MMDTQDTSAPASYIDPYQQYLNTGRLAPMPSVNVPAQGSQGYTTAPPTAAPTPAQPQPPTFSDLVTQAEKANGGKPLDPTAIDALSTHLWTQSEPQFRLSRKGITAGDVAAEKAAWDDNVARFKDAYAKAHPAAAAAAESARHPFLNALTVAGKSAAGGLEQGAAELGRYGVGGVAALGDDIYNLIPGHANKPGELADDYFKWTDPKYNAMIAQGRGLQQSASERSPVSAFVGSLPGAVLSGGTIPTLNHVGDEADAGATVGQQEGTLGIDTAANIAGAALGGSAGAKLAEKLGTTAAKRVGLRLAGDAAVNAGIGAAQQVGAHAIDPKNNPISGTSIAEQAILGTALGEAGHQYSARLAANEYAAAAGHKPGTPEYNARKAAFKAAGGKAPPPPAPGAGTAPPAVDMTGAPIKDASGNTVPTPAGVDLPTVPSGAGIPPEQHAAVVAEATQQAQDPTAVKTFEAAVAKNPALKDPVARAKEVVAHAGAIAESAAQDSGTDWAAMSPIQQHDATEAAAQVLAKTTQTEGVPELLQAQRAALAAAPTGPQVTETGEPPVAPAAAAEVPGQESGAPAISPQTAQATAEEALSGGQSTSPLTAPQVEPLDQTAADTQDLQSREAHAQADAELKKFRKGVIPKYSKAKLAGMTLAEKVQALHDEASATSGAAPSEPNASQPAFDPTIARNAADAYAAALHLKPVPGATPGPPRGGHGLLPLDTSHDVPLGGGTTLDGKPTSGHDISSVVIDPSIPKTILIDGHDVDVHWGITQHEIFESWLMHHYGMGYEAAHNGALQFEDAQYAKRYPGIDPAKVQAALKPFLDKVDAQAKKGMTNQPEGYDANPANNAGVPEVVDASKSPNAKTADVLKVKGRGGAATAKGEGSGTKKAPAPVEANPLEPTASSVPDDVVGQTLEGKVTPADLADVRTLVERAQNGMPEDLHARINEMRGDDLITAEDAKTLRKAGREAPPEANLREGHTPEDTTKPLEDLQDAQRGEAPTTDLGKAGEDLARAVEGIPTGLKSDRARAAEVIAKLRKLFPDSPNHQKATDFLAWVLGRNPALVRTFHDVAKTPMGADVQHGGRFNETRVGSAVSRILELVDRPNMAPDTAVHEIMHAAESLLPQPIREAIANSRLREIDRLAGTASSAEKPLFEYLQNGAKAKTPAERALYMSGAKEELLKLRDSGASQRIGELYALTNSSEYWAVHATTMLKDGFQNRSVLAQAQRWLKGFIDHIRGLFGNRPNKQAIIDGLNHVLGTQETGTQAFLRQYDLVREQYAGQPEGLTPMAASEQLHSLVFDPDEEREGMLARAARVLTNFRETVADNAAYMDKFNEGVRRLGIQLTPQQDLKLAFKRMTGQRGEAVIRAADDFVEPIKAAIVTYGHLLSNDPIQAEDQLGLFQQLRHIVQERYPQKYREDVPLENGREVMRQKILQKLKDRQIAPQVADAQLKALVAKSASMPFDEWARQTYGSDTKSGETFYDQAVRKLAELDNKGIRHAAEQHFDPLYRALNDEVNRLNIASGRLAADDPYIAFYGHKNFASLRGSALDGTREELAGATLPNDLEAIHRMRLKSTNLDKAMKTADGRSSLASNPALNALARLEEAARGVPNKDFVTTVFDTMGDLKKQLRARARDITASLKAETNPERLSALRDQLHAVTAHEGYNTSVEAYTGIPRDGYDSASSGQHFDELPTKPNTLVMHDGRQHYILTFPEGSEVFHSLKAINSDFDVRQFPMIRNLLEGVEHAVSSVTKRVGLGEQTHMIGRSTSFMAQVHTIVNPVWDITKLMARLLIEKPVMLALQHSSSPLDAIPILAHVYGNILGGVFHKGTGSWARMMFSHDRVGLRDAAAKDPDSMAGWMVRMNEAGGGTAFTQELTMHATRNALAQAGRQSRQFIGLKAVRGYLHYAQGIADIAENLPSVGIFRSLVKSGMDDRTAGAYTKMAFDLQQRGTAGKAINSYHAFFRIAATSTDNLMRAFRHPLGAHDVQVMGRTVNTSVDWPKLAKFSVAIAGYAFAKYFLDREMLGDDPTDGKSRLAKIAAVNPVDLVQNSFIPDGSNHPGVYPMGLGAAQLMTAPGTLMAAVAHGDLTLSQAMNAYGETLMRNIPLVEGSPTPQNAGLLAHLFAIGMGALSPTAATPGVSVWRNVNNFGEPIHVSDPKPDLYAADQGKTNTPEMWKEIAQSVQHTTGIDFYPETLKFMSENYLGSVPTDLMRATIGQTTRTAQGLPNNALAGLGRVTYQGMQYYDSSRMYHVEDELNGTQQQLHSIQLQAGVKGSPQYQEAGQQWLQSNPDAQVKLTALNRLKAAQKTYQAGIKALTNSNAGPERKQYVRKQLDSALRTATDAAEKAIQ